jgi:AcrR family transcriptional regulator
VLAAAREMFRERGFDNASMKDLGAAVGINEPELSDLFASKEALLAAVLDADDGGSETSSPRKRDRDMKAKVLTAARELFYERGFNAVSIDAIGAKVGITGPGVYRHYGSKDNLLMAVLEDGHQRMQARVKALPDEHDLEQLVRAHVNHAIDNPDVMSIWYAEARHLPDQIRQAHGDAQRRFMESFVVALLKREPQLDPEEAKLMIVAMLGMVVHTATYFQKHDVPDQRKREILTEMALRSVGFRLGRVS